MAKRNIFSTTHFQRLAASVMLLIIALYYINVSLFPHVHIVDGVTIVHSHFCSESHSNSGDGHTESELTLINIISQYIAEVQDTFIFASVVVLSASWLYFTISWSATPINRTAHPQLRAPPALAVIIG